MVFLLIYDYHKTSKESDSIISKPQGSYNMIIFALKHDEYIHNLNQIIKDHSISSPPTFIVDLQDMVPPGIADFSV